MKVKKAVAIGVFLICFVTFLLLLYRDPFSERTLIPNFEPYPDTIHYVNPALSFLKGEGLRITREGRGFYPNVPPLYTLFLIPFFSFNQDPRIFYFANVFLSIVSFFLFYLVLKKLFKNIWIVGLVLFLFATNYYLYWYPSLAMAENLILSLFLGMLLLLISKPNFNKSILAGLIAISFFATKYSSLPLTAVFFLLYIFNILKNENKNQRLKLLSVFFLFFFLSSVFLLSYEYFVKKNTFGGILTRESISKLDRQETSYNPSFSLKYAKTNTNLYIDTLLGKETRFLWETNPFFPAAIAIPSLIGLAIALFTRRYRFIGFSLILFLAGSIILLSSFYTFDARYIYHAVPTLLLGGGFLIGSLEKVLRGNYKIIFYLILFVLFLSYSLVNKNRLRAQVLLNLKFSEVPWYYKSVLELNKSFKNPPKSRKKPIVISALSPYFIDFYSNGNYDLLPLHHDQEFRHVKAIAWGPNDYSNLIELYKKYLAQGYTVYIHNYGLGNEDYLKDEYKKVEDTFILEKVQEGCYNACNIYKLEMKR